MRVSFNPPNFGIRVSQGRFRVVSRIIQIACCLLIASIAQASNPVFQGAFQNRTRNWTAERGTATLDASVVHDKGPSLRVERDATVQDACVRLAPITLVLGRRYELSGWIRTEGLEVRDLRTSRGCEDLRKGRPPSRGTRDQFRPCSLRKDESGRSCR